MHNNSVKRAFQILETFTVDSPLQGVTEISRKTGLNKATVFRFLKSLEEIGIICRDQKTGYYKLGLRLFELGYRVPIRDNVIQQMHPILEQLVEKIKMTVHLATLREDEVLYIDKIRCRKSLQINTHIGARYPAYCTALGKSMLAHLPEKELDSLLRRQKLLALTKNSITDPDLLKVELQKTRERGYAVDNEEFEEGLRCVAVPILGYDKRPLVAISVSGALSQVSEETIPLQVKLLKEAAEKIQKQLYDNKMTLRDFI